LAEIEQACKKSDFLYKRDWLGERTIPEGVIYFMFKPEQHILAKMPGDLAPIEMYFAGDGGTTDATSIGCYIVAGRTDMIGRINKYMLFRVGNWYYDKGDKAMSTQAREIVQKFIPRMREKYRMRESNIFIDPACKALRLEIEKYGLTTSGADNNAHDIRGSSKGIRVGIETLQSGITDGRFYLVEDEQYTTEAFMTEAGLYCVDNNGNPIDAYNHAMDETRYGWNYFYKNYMMR
jgi:PBSX family phage terminase large subunit